MTALLAKLTREQDDAVAEAARLHECGFSVHSAAVEAHKKCKNCGLTIDEIVEHLQESLKANA